jgi:hypothetical protein
VTTTSIDGVWSVGDGEVLLGVYPMLKAARIDPIDAVRYE